MDNTREGTGRQPVPSPPFLPEKKNSMARLFWITILLFLMITAPVQAASWIDEVGRSVELPEKPQRIISLVPSVTEILFALGLGDRLVGATQFCTYPPEAKAIPRIGNYMHPSLEAIVAKGPDLVFAASDAASPALVSQLERMGIATFVVTPHDLDSTLQSIRIVGRVMDKAEAAERLAKGLEQTFCRIRRATAKLAKPRVLLSVMVTPLTVAGPGTLGNTLIEAAGGINVVPPGPGRYPSWGMEAVLAADPDVIIVSPNPGESNPASHFASWPQLKAVRNNRVVTISDPDWIHRPGPRLALGLEAMAEALHGKNLPSKDAPCP